MHGSGKFTYASGTCYDGQWEHSEYQGTGTFSWPDGRRYEVWIGSHPTADAKRLQYTGGSSKQAALPSMEHTTCAQQGVTSCAACKDDFNTTIIRAQAICPKQIAVLYTPCCSEAGFAASLSTAGSAILPAGVFLQGLWEHNRMHGQGTYTDAEGHQWSGQFFNGSGPGLTCML